MFQKLFIVADNEREVAVVDLIFLHLTKGLKIFQEHLVLDLVEIQENDLLDLYLISHHQSIVKYWLKFMSILCYSVHF